MRTLAIIFMLLAAGASAESRPEVGFGFTVIAPPAEYNSEPLGRLEVYYLPQPKVIEMCSRAAGKFEDIGCTWPPSSNADFCMIVIAEEVYDDLKRRVLVHEKAHCNGWPADHPLDEPAKPHPDGYLIPYR